MSDLAVRIAGAGLDWIVPAWDASPAVGALCTTRNGGVATGLAASLDVGPARLDTLDDVARAAVLANRSRVQAFLPSAPVYLEQVHGRDVARIDAANLAAARAAPPVGDAAVTRLAGVPLAVRVADCLPVLFASRDASVVGAAHAGWRGLAAGVLDATIAALGVAPADVVAWLGPAIGPRAFEVGDDVRDAFLQAADRSAEHFRPLRAGKWLADLPSLARQRLDALGVRSVAALDACTFSEPARFHSWRRDRSPGRLAAYVWRAADQ
ncbi:MAG TPA: peptidoglycan editing factor PgeF [Casimicrobiaceae bacterium]|nr:peptidoglycan editing factor PgeF [Casimicrobiaceae bacterium]